MSLLNDGCGCVTPTGTGWETETTALIAEMEKVFGTLPLSIGDKLNDIVVEAKDGGSGTPGSGTVTSFSFTNSTGITGTVTLATSTPTLSLVITKSAVGLSNVDNTSDATKNAATATLTNKTISGLGNTLSNIPESAVTNLTTDLAGKQDTLVSATNIKTVNGNTLLGSGDLVISGGGSSALSSLSDVTITSPVTSDFIQWNGSKWINRTVANVKSTLAIDNVDNTSDATKNAAVATLTNKTLTTPAINSPTGLVKGDVGLGNVDNTSDANKPVSTAQATAIATKEPTITAGTTAQYYRGDKTFQTLNKAAVGLSAVANVDQTNAANITSGALATARAGVPSGGASGYVLTKNSSGDYDTYWAAGGGGGGAPAFTLVKIASAFTTATAGSYVPVTGLSFPVVSGKTYDLKIYLVLSSADAAHSIDIYAYHNSSISVDYGFTEAKKSTPLGGAGFVTGSNVSTFNITSAALGATDKIIFTLEQTFKVNASGTYQLHVFNNSSATSITVDLGSYLKYLEF